MKRFHLHLVLWSIGGLLLGTAWGWWHGTEMRLRGAEVQKLSEAPAPPRVISAAAKKTSGATSSLALCQRLASASREELVALTKEMLAGGADYQMTLLLWTRWVEVDPVGGYEALLAGEFITDDPMSHAWSYLAKWSALDPDTAVERALVLPLAHAKKVSLARISEELSSNRPADFFRLLPELKTTSDWGRAVTRLAATDLGAARKLFESGIEGVLPASSPHVAGALASGWAKAEPATAIDYFRKHESAEVRAAGLTAVAARLIRTDPELAATVLAEADRAEAAGEMAKEWAATNPDAALEWLAKHFPEQSASNSGQIAQANIPREAAAAVDFMARHADALFGKGGVFPVSSYEVNVDDPQAALNAAAAVEDQRTRARIESVILEVMARRTPQEALEAAARLAKPDVAVGSVNRAAVQTWAKSDLTAASGWVAQQQPGWERDTAIQGLLDVAASAEPDSALHWAAALSQAGTRARELARVLQASRQTQDAAVEAALQNLPLSPADKEAVKQQLKPLNPTR